MHRECLSLKCIWNSTMMKEESSAKADQEAKKIVENIKKKVRTEKRRNR